MATVNVFHYTKIYFFKFTHINSARHSTLGFSSTFQEVITLLFLLVIDASAYFSKELSSSICFSDVLDIFFPCNFNQSLSIHFHYMFVPFSSSPFRPLNWLDIAGSSNLLASYSIFVLPASFLSTFISFPSNICLAF